MSQDLDRERVKILLFEALARPAPEREAFVIAEAGDDTALREEVLELLRAAHRHPTLLSEPTRAVDPEARAGQPAAPDTETAGAMVGRYKLLRQVGTGGFGVVWMAEQQEPVVRRVALKIIKLGMDTKQVVARFEAERQALALMDHPNIAKVFDGGATDSGRPYFVMELVKGIPITSYCDQAKLSTRQRLELFMQVCHALQHAHQKGIIHRDIKPGNVLVTLHDGDPVPKVIDFGVAKATDRRLTEKTLFTEFQQVIGTPDYMSPEQAEMSGLDIDTRADIYSLGVLLYELLTGTRPFDAAAMREKGYFEMLRVIREEEPQKPSTRISTLGDQLEAVANKRRAQSRRLGKLVRGDLDWIVMNALEKDRVRRYETARDFAEDVRRHLRGEPVEAGAPSTTYRLGKLMRKHRGLVAAVLAVFVALLIGLVTALGQARIARRVARENRAAALAYAASKAAATRPEVALLLAKEALDLEETPVTRSALHAAYLAAAEYTALAGHDRALRSVACSPDGTFYATGCDDRTVRLWSHDGKEIRAIPSEPLAKGVTQVCFASNSEILAACRDGFAYLWDLNGNEIRRFDHRDESENTEVYSIAVQDQWILTGDEWGVLRLWDRTSREPLRTFSHYERDFEETGAPEKIKSRQHMVMAVALNPNLSAQPEAFAASASLNGTVRLWSEGGRSKLLSGPRNPSYGTAFSPDGRYLSRASPDVTVYDLETQSLVRFPVAGGVYSARFSSRAMWENDQKWILVASSDSTVRLFDLNGKQLSVFRGHRDQVTDAVFSLPNGERILSASADKTARLWVLHRQHVPTLRGHEDRLRSACFTTDSKAYVSSSQDGTVRVWGSNGEALAIHYGSGSEANRDNIRWARMTPSGRLFACSDQGGVWFWGPGGRPSESIVELGQVMCFDVSQDETRIAVAGFNGTAMYPVSRTWGAPTILENHPNGYERKFTIGFSRDDTEIVTGGERSGITEIWSSSTGERDERFAPVGSSRMVHSADFSGDGKRILTSTNDGWVRIWGRPANASAKPLFEWLHPGSATYAAFAPDSDRILTTCRDGIARLWTERGKLFMEVPGHRDVIWRGAWSPDGKRVITASFDYTAQVWIADIDALIRLANERLETAKFRRGDLDPYREMLGDRIDEIAARN